MHPYLMNGTRLDELERRFDDDVDGYPQSLADPSRAPAEPAHQAAIANRQECSLAEYQAFEAQARRALLAALDAWRDDEVRIAGIFAAIKQRRISRVETNP
jgi:phytoene dehydrogenase-like protein